MLQYCYFIFFNEENDEGTTYRSTKGRSYEKNDSTPCNVYGSLTSLFYGHDAFTKDGDFSLGFSGNFSCVCDFDCDDYFPFD